MDFTTLHWCGDISPGAPVGHTHRATESGNHWRAPWQQHEKLCHCVLHVIIGNVNFFSSLTVEGNGKSLWAYCRFIFSLRLFSLLVDNVSRVEDKFSSSCYRRATEFKNMAVLPHISPQQAVKQCCSHQPLVSKELIYKQHSSELLIINWPTWPTITMHRCYRDVKLSL